ncbi:unnamed protein product [Paramecium primaurelia]|uniref:Protein kinase domain-containing protein n=1 Tax=Paramecium primaurelia TaxID=5886 RepID=A0A8S1PZ11_PARPR|nr:unnamed protein product [Paramecium primaurelia]
MASNIKVSHYSINTDEILGKGSYGIVYACQSDNLKNKDLCVKVLLILIRLFLIRHKFLKKFNCLNCSKKLQILIQL